MSPQAGKLNCPKIDIRGLNLEQTPDNSPLQQKDNRKNIQISHSQVYSTLPYNIHPHQGNGVLWQWPMTIEPGSMQPGFHSAGTYAVRVHAWVLTQGSKRRAVGRDHETPSDVRVLATCRHIQGCQWCCYAARTGLWPPGLGVEVRLFPV